jgi:hypothetical protein
LKRFEEEGIAGLADKSRGRPVGVRKVTLAAIEEVRKLARNPQIGAFRVHAALEQKGFDLSRATCGRILARVREIYGYEKPKAGGGEAGGGAKKPMPFRPTGTTNTGLPTCVTWTCSRRACLPRAWSMP